MNSLPSPGENGYQIGFGRSLSLRRQNEISEIHYNWYGKNQW